MKVLVVGGAGYIGSHMVKILHRAGADVIIIDNLSTGYQDAVRYGEFIKGDLIDLELLESVLSNHKISCVMHFASHISVEDSVRRPAEYYRNNVTCTQNLLDAMVGSGVCNFVFSSSAAVYGEPLHVSIDEGHPRMPINPYGRSKFMVEEILNDYERAYGIKSMVLRYFNAAGADPEGELGERHEPETHLIPLVLQVASGRRSHIKIFGRDYDTPDGTCIRDYIHIMDLCEAHFIALKVLAAGGRSGCYNLGNGRGFSVQEVVDSARLVTGRNIEVQYGPRRNGDVARLVADASRARRELDWVPNYADLQTIIGHAWQWEISYCIEKT